MESLIGSLSDILRRHVHSVALALVATFLALYGSYINEAMKKVTKDLHFLIRFCIFVLLVTLGFGMLSLLITRLLERLMWKISDLYLAPSVILAFLILGLLANRRKDI